MGHISINGKLVKIDDNTSVKRFLFYDGRDDIIYSAANRVVNNFVKDYIPRELIIELIANTSLLQLACSTLSNAIYQAIIDTEKYNVDRIEALHSISAENAAKDFCDRVGLRSSLFGNVMNSDDKGAELKPCFEVLAEIIQRQRDAAVLQLLCACAS
jgi:hypothetical protein